jgi:methyl-accepting chemotaxis protein
MGARRKNNSQETLDLGPMIQDLEAIKLGKQINTVEYAGVNKETVDKLKALVGSDCSTHNSFVNEVDQLMQTLMTMDFVREMIRGAEHQSEMVETIAATSEEMAANIEDIAQFVKDSLNSAHDSNQKALISKKLMNETVESIEGSYKETELAKEQIIGVNEQTQKIDEMVNIIISVAAQTNLLALNASIEAARAGESGKGFAVVANEIKKLADHTKESVNFIQESVRNLRTQVEASTAAIEKASASFLKGKKSLAEVLLAIEAVDVSTKEIEANMQQINSNIEQQTASSQEVSSSAQIINEKTKDLHMDSIRTGKGFYTISLEIDDLRKNLIKKSKGITTRDSIELCITDHLNWRWRVYNMILGNTQIEANLVADPNQSRLGRWLQNYGSKEPAFEQSIRRLEGPRTRLHQYAEKAVTAYNKGDIQGAENYLHQLDEVSLEMVQILREMQSKCSR